MRPIGQEPISCSLSMRQLDVQVHLLDMTLVCCRDLPPIQNKKAYLIVISILLVSTKTSYVRTLFIRLVKERFVFFLFCPQGFGILSRFDGTATWKLSMVRMIRVFNDPPGFSDTPAVVKVLDGGKLTPTDLLCCPHHPLHCRAIESRTASKPGSETSSQNTFNSTSVEGAQNPRTHAKFL